MNIFSFFSGAGFLDLGFELQGNYDIVFVNEFHEAFNRVYRFARHNMNIGAPANGYHIEDITEYLDGNHNERLHNLEQMVNQSKAQALTGFIGGPPCPDFSVAGRNKGKEGENGLGYFPHVHVDSSFSHTRKWKIHLGQTIRFHAPTHPYCFQRSNSVASFWCR